MRKTHSFLTYTLIIFALSIPKNSLAACKHPRLLAKTVNGERRIFGCTTNADNDCTDEIIGFSKNDLENLKHQYRNQKAATNGLAVALSIAAFGAAGGGTIVGTAIRQTVINPVVAGTPAGGVVKTLLINGAKKIATNRVAQAVGHSFAVYNLGGLFFEFPQLSGVISKPAKAAAVAFQENSNAASVPFSMEASEAAFIGSAQGCADEITTRLRMLKSLSGLPSRPQDEKIRCISRPSMEDRRKCLEAIEKGTDQSILLRQQIQTPMNLLTPTDLTPYREPSTTSPISF